MVRRVLRVERSEGEERQEREVEEDEESGAREEGEQPRGGAHDPNVEDDGIDRDAWAWDTERGR